MTMTNAVHRNMPQSLYRNAACTLPLAGILVAATAWAAGGGGGGGGGGGSGSDGSNPITSTCVNDTYFCSDWSTCSAEGQQTRACQISFDCPNAADPTPPESQPCIPPCTADEWACNPWSTCTREGRQQRGCTISHDCPTTETPRPAEEQACTPPPVTPPLPQPTPTPSPTPARLRPSPRATPRPTPRATPNPTPMPTTPGLPVCNTLPTLRERVRCRLTIPPPELERQQGLDYLPEECRSIGDRVAQQQCVDLYRQLQACWKFPVGPARIGCVKKIITLDDVAAATADCDRLPKNSTADCRNTLRSKVYSLIKFRFYDLEERAEDLLERGAPVELVANFVAAQEAAKQRFNLATTNAQRRAIILEVRRAWREFVQRVSPSLK